jgi:hypothetical protein
VKSGLRVGLALFALALALALLWRKVHIIFVVQVGWLQLLLMVLFLALVIYLLLDLILRRLGR